MKQPLVGIFGYKAINDQAEAVLDGTFIPSQDTDPYVTKLLPHLVQPKTITGETLVPDTSS